MLRKGCVRCAGSVSFGAVTTTTLERRVWLQQDIVRGAAASARGYGYGGCSVLVAVAGAGAALVATKSRDRVCVAPASCAGAPGDDNSFRPGMTACLGIGAVVVATAYVFNKKATLVTGATESRRPQRNLQDDDLLDPVLDQMQSHFGLYPAEQYAELVKASGSTARAGIIINNLTGNYKLARSVLEKVDCDDVGVVSLSEFMALSAMSSIMAPSSQGASIPSLNDIVFGFFAAVDEDLDGEISENQWRSLHKVMNMFGLLPSLAQTGLTDGAVELLHFRSCCRLHLSQRRLAHRYGKE